MARVVLDTTDTTWQGLVKQMIDAGDTVVALRGAGSFNGISVADANRVLDTYLFQMVNEHRFGSMVNILFDGDNDDPEYSDIGHIAGRLYEKYHGYVQFYAVQSLAWYKYRAGLPNAVRPLHTASGLEYDTILFPSDTFPGDHSHFTQCKELATYENYEQWYVGACGKIAHSQLGDYNAKVRAGGVGHGMVYFFPLPVSFEQETKIRGKLATSTDEAQKQRLRDLLDQRALHPNGLLFTSKGELVGVDSYDHLKYKVYR